MDIVPFLSTIILVTTLATLILAVVSYVTFKMRDARKPAAKKATLHSGAAPAKTFFARYQPPEAAKAGPAGG